MKNLVEKLNKYLQNIRENKEVEEQHAKIFNQMIKQVFKVNDNTWNEGDSEMDYPNDYFITYSSVEEDQRYDSGNMEDFDYHLVSLDFLKSGDYQIKIMVSKAYNSRINKDVLLPIIPRSKATISYLRTQIEQAIKKAYTIKI